MQAGDLAPKGREGPACWSLQHSFPLALLKLPDTAFGGGLDPPQKLRQASVLFLAHRHTHLPRAHHRHTNSLRPPKTLPPSFIG